MPRRSAHCAFRRTLLCLVSRDRLLWFFEFTSPSDSGDRSEYGCDRGLAFRRFGLRGRLPPKLSVATLRSCRPCGCVPRGQRALLDADMLELIDRSACLVEPVSVESCAPSVLVLSPAASTSSAASGRCSRMSFPRGLVEGLLLPESSLRAAPVASLRLLLLDDRDLSLFCLVVDVMCFLTDLLCFVFLLHNCENCGRRDPLVRCAVPPFLHGFSELSPNEAASPSSAETSGRSPHSSVIALQSVQLLCLLACSPCHHVENLLSVMRVLGALDGSSRSRPSHLEQLNRC